MPRSLSGVSAQEKGRGRETQKEDCEGVTRGTRGNQENKMSHILWEAWACEKIGSPGSKVLRDKDEG